VGLNCPLPILKAKKALNDHAKRPIVESGLNHKGSLRDFAAFAKQTGNELMSQETVGEEFVQRFKRR
jgi:TusA-related sulfurtransferase